MYFISGTIFFVLTFIITIMISILTTWGYIFNNALFIFLAFVSFSLGISCWYLQYLKEKNQSKTLMKTKKETL